jgi:predicted O-linked N-acetylglucosamine transferase (SPINDLY family)
MIEIGYISSRLKQHKYGWLLTLRVVKLNSLNVLTVSEGYATSKIIEDPVK